MRKSCRLFALAALLGVATALGAGHSARAETGTVEFEITKAGFIVGVGGGTGILIFKGRRYPLSVSGMSFGATIGASKARLVGRALNLRQASDIVGNYTAGSSGVAFAGGGGGARLRNQNGVVLEVRGRKVGFEFSASVSGVEIKMR